MRTVKWNPFLSGVGAVLGGALAASVASADVSSTNPAAIVIFPKIVVGPTTNFPTPADTIVQLSNTSDRPVNVRCFYINANGHCSTTEAICDPSADPAVIQTVCGTGNHCVPGWVETDFAFRLTPKQPVIWLASKGLAKLPLADQPGPRGHFNGGSVPPVPENPMVGELKCVEVGDDERPTDDNDLKGEATIETVGGTDARSYNAIGIQAIDGANNGDNTLVLGQEYNSCPSVLILSHFFDRAVEPAFAGTVTSDLTLVPCSQDLNLQETYKTTVQYLVYNEFEQRFSTSKPINCFTEISLSDIDSRPGPTGNPQSIFGVEVQGTLTGQTIVRGVNDGSDSHGNGLLGVLEEYHNGAYSAAVVAHQRGRRTQNDRVVLPAAQPGS